MSAIEGWDKREIDSATGCDARHSESSGKTVRNNWRIHSKVPHDHAQLLQVGAGSLQWYHVQITEYMRSTCLGDDRQLDPAGRHEHSRLILEEDVSVIFVVDRKLRHHPQHSQDRLIFW